MKHQADHLTIAISAILLLAPLVGADSSEPIKILSIEASHFNLAGPVAINGNLAALHTFGQPSGTLLEMNAASSSLSVLTYHAYRNLTIPPLVAINQEFSTSSDTYYNAALVLTEQSPAFKAYLAPLEPGSATLMFLDSEGVEAIPSKQNHVEELQFMSSREAQREDVSRAIEVIHGLEGNRVEIRGSFYLSLWGANFTASGEAGKDEHWTGQKRESVAPGVGRHEERVAELRFEDGVLQFKVTSPASLEFFLDDFNAVSGGGLTASNPRGAWSISGKEHSVNGQELRVPGPVEGRSWITPTGQLAIELHGAPTHYELDGQITQISPNPIGNNDADTHGSVAVQPEHAGLTSTGVMAVLLAGAGAAVLVFVLLLRPSYGAVSVALRLRQYRVVAWLTRNPARFNRPEATVARAVSLIRLGRLDAAQAAIQVSDPSRQPDRATAAYLEASIHARRDERQETLDCLHECLTIAPQYLEEILLDPWFKKVLPTPVKGAVPVDAEAYA